MINYQIVTDASGNQSLETNMHGKPLLTIPQLNKGTAFSERERLEFNLIGKLPPHIETLEQQVERAYLQFKSFDDPINRYMQLFNLMNANHVLFFRLLRDHLEEMIPYVYTPFVGRAVQLFSRRYLSPYGLYLSYQEQDYIEQALDSRTNPDIHLIVVSDGEGVLGIGDQGIGAIAIPVAKLMLYTALAGISPLNTLPIFLDAGTNNQELLDDPLYLGSRHPRISGAPYDAFIERFINAVKKKFPHVFLHWEDFGRHNAYKNLISYREKICSFNDDIQGTGVVTLGALMAASKLANDPITNHRIVIFGAGTAGMGVTNNIYQAFIRLGLSESEACDRFWLVDRFGLITDRSEQITPAQEPFVKSSHTIANWTLHDPGHISLLETVQHVKPTVLIGCSAQGGAFTEDVVKAMASHTPRPIIFPLSNPTEKAEAHPSDLIRWTDGQALIATGSPFSPVDYKGTRYPISQCNNVLAFPSIGLGVIAVKARRVTDDMLWAASCALSEFTQMHPPVLLPTPTQMAHGATVDIAKAVAEIAIKDNIEGADATTSLEALIKAHQWSPHYLPYHRIQDNTAG